MIYILEEIEIAYDESTSIIIYASANKEKVNDIKLEKEENLKKLLEELKEYEKKYDSLSEQEQEIFVQDRENLDKLFQTYHHQSYSTYYVIKKIALDKDLSLSI
jgi:hypothetical protein